MPLHPEPDSALLIVDVQNDFCPGGSLAVAGGDEVIPVLNRYAEAFVEAGCLVIADRDWHPSRTTHFLQYGGTWPVHCVQGTPGSISGPMASARTPSASTTAPEVSPPATTNLRTPFARRPRAIARNACSIASPRPAVIACGGAEA